MGQVCSVENLRFLLSASTEVAATIMSEDQQISASCPQGGLSDWWPCASAIRTPLQSQEVHAAAVVCLPGAQGVPATRLPKTGRPVVRLAGTMSRDRPGGRSPLYDLSKGGPAIVAGAPRRAVTGQDDTVGRGHRPNPATGCPGRR